MVKKNREAQPAKPSPEETDSDTSSTSSSDGEGSPSPPTTADKKSAAQNKSTEATKAMDAGSESDDSDSDSPLKPIASKAMDDGAKLKKPRSKPNSKPAASPAKTPTKRGAAVEGERESKKSKSEKGEGGTEEEGKKSALFQRLWSDDDEIVILKGMLEYKEKKGADPMADANDFHDFIRESLHVDVDRRQVVDKVRRLRKRYQNSVGKKKTFNAHEKNAFELSTKIWGNKMKSADADQQTKSNMKTKAVSKPSSGKNLGSTGTDGNSARNGALVSSNGMKDVENSGPGLEKVGSSWQFIGKASISMGLDENIVKVGLELCNEDKKAELEEKWRLLHLEESNLFSRKLDLAQEESKMITEAFRAERM